MLAVVGASAVARRVADASSSGTLGRLAASRGLTADALLDGMYDTGPVALMLEARDELPASIVKVDESGRARVLVVGQTPVDPRNLHDQLFNHLARDRGVLIAGSSGNRSGARTYTTWDHVEAQADFGGDVDVFVRPNLPIPARRAWDAPVSCSGFDLTTPEPTLIRHGSLHPDVFRPVLRRFDVAPSVQRIAGRQRKMAGIVERLRPAG